MYGVVGFVIAALLTLEILVSVWMFRFSSECVAEIVARTLSATSPRYSAIKELDRKIREFSPSSQALEAIRGGPGVDARSLPLPASMLAFMLSNISDISESTSRYNLC